MHQGGLRACDVLLMYPEGELVAGKGSSGKYKLRSKFCGEKWAPDLLIWGRGDYPLCSSFASHSDSPHPIPQKKKNQQRGIQKEINHKGK